MPETRTRIKICGITNQEDADAAVSFGADALGFIQVRESPRFVTSKAYLPILASLPPFVSAVAVSAEYPDTADPMLRHFGVIQHYFGSPIRDASILPRRVRAFRIKDVASIESLAAEIESCRPDAIHLDTYRKEVLGGSGETFDWSLAAEVRERFDIPIILAGGLTAENVEEAIAMVRPYAVDVSSGVEAKPGRKDHGKLAAFIEAVRRADVIHADT